MLTWQQAHQCWGASPSGHLADGSGLYSNLLTDSASLKRPPLQAHANLLKICLKQNTRDDGSTQLKLHSSNPRQYLHPCQTCQGSGQKLNTLPFTSKSACFPSSLQKDLCLHQRCHSVLGCMQDHHMMSTALPGLTAIIAHGWKSTLKLAMTLKAFCTSKHHWGSLLCLYCGHLACLLR